ncbi:kynurenine formamidase isoform X3 [Zootermopsis nevadensis]|uniref:kynurenine formamidase isoform X3 n=1 Tax=Zootermopsis nevadensis TaxID=136037 RepID=UPI000B8EDA9D|nr:kynurenine formamidase isoform X3 [Zootermopsis nevadensis]
MLPCVLYIQWFCVFKELTLQYSPSFWSQRFQDPAAVIANHIQLITAASDAARKEVPVECGVKYGPKEGQILDLFGGKSLPHDAPILVYIHGGYWQELSRDISAYCVVPQYQSGIRVIILGYDLAPRVKLSEIVEEIKEAAEYILNMAAKFGTRSLWFCGHSAGAQLVAMLLFSKWLDQLDDSVFRLLKGFVLISGVYDLTPLVSTYINNSLKLSSQEARSLSPLLLDITSPAVTKLRILVAVGDHDSPEFQRQSYEFAEKLRQHSQQVEYMTVAGVDHFDIVENLQQKDFILTKIIGVLMTG